MTTSTPQKWIESKEGITVILRHGAEVAQAYQHYVDRMNDAPQPTYAFAAWHIVWLQLEPWRRKYLRALSTTVIRVSVL